MNPLTLEKLKFPIGKCPKIDDVSKNELENWKYDFIPFCR